MIKQALHRKVLKKSFFFFMQIPPIILVFSPKQARNCYLLLILYHILHKMSIENDSNFLGFKKSYLTKAKQKAILIPKTFSNSCIKSHFLAYNGIKKSKEAFYMKPCKKIIAISLIFVFLLSHISLCTESFVWDDSMIPTSGENATGNFLNLESGSAILIEQNSGKILYEHNIHEQLRPASVTKIMSILLIMEALDSGKISLTDTVPCSENARNMGGSQIWLNETEQLTVDEMLKAICVVSANDCVVAMAEFLAGSEEIFVGQMNNKAKELGMNDTHFVNCHGIDEDGHVTTSYDIALMSRELLTKHPSITNYTTIWMDSLRDRKI